MCFSQWYQFALGNANQYVAKISTWFQDHKYIIIFISILYDYSETEISTMQNIAIETCWTIIYWMKKILNELMIQLIKIGHKKNFIHTSVHFDDSFILFPKIFFLKQVPLCASFLYVLISTIYVVYHWRGNNASIQFARLWIDIIKPNQNIWNVI